ncbi:hypothetical protein NDU88_000689 [Pleurodeles waltl]|uniref:Uncharacterized protein n=1 Tax=Pleurodeles waltl TaxID=8319 RepID=A0AAV7S7P4_PLEWA|nr:hypothetical protein NDU88_000689 [Pleurodeles waltl]
MFQAPGGLRSPFVAHRFVNHQLCSVLQFGISCGDEEGQVGSPPPKTRRLAPGSSACSRLLFSPPLSSLAAGPVKDCARRCPPRSDPRAPDLFVGSVGFSVVFARPGTQVRRREAGPFAWGGRPPPANCLGQDRNRQGPPIHWGPPRVPPRPTTSSPKKKKKGPRVGRVLTSSSFLPGGVAATSPQDAPAAGWGHPGDATVQALGSSRFGRSTLCGWAAPRPSPWACPTQLQLRSAAQARREPIHGLGESPSPPGPSPADQGADRLLGPLQRFRICRKRRRALTARACHTRWLGHAPFHSPFMAVIVNFNSGSTLKSSAGELTSAC